MLLLLIVLALCATLGDSFALRQSLKLRSHTLTGVRHSKTLSMSFDSSFFQKEAVDMSGTTEFVVKGGTHLYPKCAEAFASAGIKKIGVIGWGSQAPAQAQNLADTLEGSDIKVTIGLREGSASFKDAKAVGFSEENGTLGEMYDVIRQSDLVILLISDAAQANLYKEIFAALKPGTCIYII